MGTWNATCMMSNLPIEEGESCVGFLIASRGRARTTTYATEKYIPITPALFGRYDGYGGLDSKIGADELIMGKLEKFGCRPETPTDGQKGTLSDDSLVIPRSQLCFSRAPGQESALMPVSLVLIREVFFNLALKHHEGDLTRWQQAQRAFAKGECKDDLFQSLLYGYSPDGMIPLCVQEIMKEGIDFSGTVAVTRELGLLRREWAPASGAGSQRGVGRRVLAFYEAMLDEAKHGYSHEEPSV